MSTNPHYNRGSAIAAHTRAKASDLLSELANIQAGFDSVETAIQSIEAGGGVAKYTHYAYADSSDGTQNFTTGTPGSRSYVGVLANSASATPSENPANYIWSLFAGSNGQYQEIRYIRSQSQPARPDFGDDPPAGSASTPPSGTDPLWFTSATRDGSGNLISAWAIYQRLTDFVAVPYNAGDTYYRDAKVFHGGGTYILIVDSSTGNAPSGTAQANAFWDVIAAPGEEGEPATPPSVFSATIDLTTATGANLRTLADAAGYTGASDATITFRVPNTVTITGAPDGGIGIDSGSWPSSSYTIALTLVVQSGGIVRGGGGKGGSGGRYSDGGDATKGGDAIYLREDFTGGITIDSGGTVQAGGGGGGGGAGSPISSAYGGGGGGGAPNGPGGDGFTSTYDGDPGTTTGGGNGDPGAGSGSSAHAGGDGGNYAATGSVGESGSTYSGGAAANPGYAVRKNGHTATVTNNGTMTGSAG